MAWQTVLDSLNPPLLDWEVGRTDKPSPSERAAFDAITLFALHIQSRTSTMHVSGRSFGTAMGMLRRVRESSSIKPRFDALLTSLDGRSRLIHARSLINLLRSEDIGFDYGMFAQDLRSLVSADRRHGVLLRWGRDFSTRPYREKETEETTATSVAEPPVS